MEIHFRRTRDRTAGDAISIFSVTGLLGFAAVRAEKSCSLRKRPVRELLFPFDILSDGMTVPE